MLYTIINFTRLGDLLQTQSTIAALKKTSPRQKYENDNNNPASHEQNRISLICLEQFVSAAHFIEELDDISIFPSSSILEKLHTKWQTALQELELWVDAYYEKFPYDMVINLTPSMNCRVFAQLLTRKAPHITLQGFGLDSMGYGENSSSWTTYIQAVTKERGCSPYNLIDGFRSMLNLAPEPFMLKKPNASLQENARAFLSQEKEKVLNTYNSLHLNRQNNSDNQTYTQVQKNSPQKTITVQSRTHSQVSYIAFQLGASNEVRQWDVENFAKLGHALWVQGINHTNNIKNTHSFQQNIADTQTHTHYFIPVLLGAQQDIPLVKAYIKEIQKLDKDLPYINLCGKTTLEELGAILSQVSALVSNDTGTLHLAVGLGTPVLGIYLATAQVWDTGPYGVAHLCLEPRLDCHPCSFSHVCTFGHKCRTSLSAQSVFNSLQFLLKNNKSLSLPKKSISLGKEFENETLSKQNSLQNSSLTNLLPSDDARIWYSYFDESGFVTYASLSGDEESERTLWMACQRLFYKSFLQRFSSSNDNGHLEELSYHNCVLPLKDKALIQTNIEFIERVLSLILLLKEQATMLHLRPSVKLQENFLSSIERINLYLAQNPSFTALYLLWKTLVQEHGQSLEMLIHFFDTLHQELTTFKEYLIKYSS